MENTTKEKILDAALVSFAENGYKGTNLRDFAASMGLSKSALYSHFESKEAIWNAMIDRMEAYYAARFGSAEHLPEIPKNAEEFYSLVMQMADFTIHDEKIILTRKLLLTEQFHDERIKKLATEHFINGTKVIFQRILEKMMENGIIQKDDPDLLAFVFTSPVTALIHYCDREPEKESEIMRQIEAYVRHFIRTYGKNQEKQLMLSQERPKEKQTDDIQTEHPSQMTKEQREAGPSEIRIVKLRERRDLKEKAAEWFSSKWNIPKDAYLDSIEASFSAVVPSWYLCLADEKIIAGMGVIENDFHNRPDLTPNVCAVFTEPEYRNRGICGRLLNYVCEDMKHLGFDTLYLLTDHTGFYERYGWNYLCPVQGDGEEKMSRMYSHDL